MHVIRENNIVVVVGETGRDSWIVLATSSNAFPTPMP